MSNLPPVPVHSQFLDMNGYVSQVWLDFLQKAFVRMGGRVAPTNDELVPVDTDRIVDGAVNEFKLAGTVAGTGLVGGAGTPLSVNPDGSTLEINGDSVRVKASGIGTNEVANDAISFIKLLSTDWTKNTGSNGYTKLGNGIYLQWGSTGSVSSATTQSVSFPTPFPNACRQVVANIIGNSAAATTTTGSIGTDLVNASSFNINNRSSVAFSFSWIAVGY